MLTALLTTFVAASTAHGYVPPSFFIVRKLGMKHESLEDARIRSKVSVYKGGGDLSRTYNEVLVINPPDKVSVKLLDETDRELATFNRRLTGSRDTTAQRPSLYDLLMVRESASIFEHFRSMGLPLKTETDLYSEKEGSMPYKPEDTVQLSRYENKVAVVLSKEKSPGSSKLPQLWIEKDSFLPLRAVLPTSPEAGVTSEPLDMRFSNYQVHKSFLYPHVIQIYRNGSLWLKIETQDVKMGSVGFADASKANSDMDGDTKGFVDTYFKWVR